MVTKVINLFAGPGAGKSVMAADIYSLLSKVDGSAELVREYVKEWAWSGRKLTPFDQLFVIGKQAHREASLYGKVSHIVTDSPLLLGVFYLEYYHNVKFMKDIYKEFNYLLKQNNVVHQNYLLKRTVKYNPKGRFETEKEALEIDVALEKFLDENSIIYRQLSLPEEVFDNVY